MQGPKRLLRPRLVVDEAGFWILRRRRRGLGRLTGIGNAPSSTGRGGREGVYGPGVAAAGLYRGCGDRNGALVHGEHASPVDEAAFLVLGWLWVLYGDSLWGNRRSLLI